MGNTMPLRSGLTRLAVIAGLWTSIGTSLEGQAMRFFKMAPEFTGFTAVAADDSGVYAFWSGGIRKYDPNGNKLWDREFNGISNVNSATYDPSGVYILGHPGPGPRGVLRKFSRDGAELWSSELVFAGRSIALDMTGIYVTGARDPGTGVMAA